MASTPSGLFNLNASDLAKGLVMAVLGAVLAVVQESLSSGTLTFDWKKIGLTAATTAVAYLIKNFFTPAPPTT